MELKLSSPFGADPIVYHWPSPTDPERDNNERAKAIVDTMKWAVKDFPALKLPLENNILTAYNCDSYESMKSLCDRFNRVINSVVALYKGTSLWQRLSKNVCRGLLKHILHQVYYQSIPEPEKLNQYEPFSPEVYGETSCEFIFQMIDELNFKSDDVFIDLGSGVGQVVLQMAAASQCKMCIGIEKADVPNKFSDAMCSNFEKWMKWFGKSYSEYELIKGNFLDQKFKDTINSASVVFVNNFAFGPIVDHSLKECFADLKDGSRIISSKAFCPVNFRISDRNLSDIGCIMHVTEMLPKHESVSWTGKPVSYYLHLIDRTKLERYFQKMKNGNSENNGYMSEEEEKPQTNGRQKNGRKRESEDSDSDVPLACRLHRRKARPSNPSEESGRESPCPKRVLRKRLPPKPAPEPPNQPNRNKHKKVKRSKKPVSITGLDLLHNQTILSTANADGTKIPPAPGCIDLQLEDFSDDDPELLMLPEATYKELDNLLGIYRRQMLSHVLSMRSKRYKTFIKLEIEKELKKREVLLKDKNNLDDHVRRLIKDTLPELFSRLEELNISATSGIDEFYSQASETCMREQILKKRTEELISEISYIEKQNDQLAAVRFAELVELGDQTYLCKEQLLEDFMKTTCFPKKEVPDPPS